MKNLLSGIFLIALGTLKVFGDLTDNRLLSGLGAASNASPAMKVFTSHQGYETHASRFFIELSWRDGGQQTIELNPAIYQRIRGPYNRRNVYGAALAYGPILIAQEKTQPLFASVSHYAFCQPGVMLDELGLRRAVGLSSAQIKLQARATHQATRFPTSLEVRCE